MRRVFGWLLLSTSAFAMAMCTKAGPEAHAFVLSSQGFWLWGVWLLLLIGGSALVKEPPRTTSPAETHAERQLVKNAITATRRSVERSTAEQKILVTAVIAVVITILFPPFLFATDSATINLGYAFLFDPPKMWAGAPPGTVNVPLLLAEWFAIVLVAIAALILVGARSSRRSGPQNERGRLP